MLRINSVFEHDIGGARFSANMYYTDMEASLGLTRVEPATEVCRGAKFQERERPRTCT